MSIASTNYLCVAVFFPEGSNGSFLENIKGVIRTLLEDTLTGVVVEIEDVEASVDTLGIWIEGFVERLPGDPVAFQNLLAQNIVNVLTSKASILPDGCNLIASVGVRSKFLGWAEGQKRS
ncbi:MAG: hypothetical protein WC244_04100 [Patescibacteria group bacterium]|jgi:hypothetical protein